MAQKVTIELVDDIDGSEAEGTVQFGLDGASYEIDLSKKNAAQIRKALAPYIESARRVGGRAKKTSKATNGTGDAKAIRAWAAENGIDVPARGRIPQEVRDQYAAAN